MKRKLFLFLLTACLGLSACQAQNLPESDNKTTAAPIDSSENTFSTPLDTPTTDPTFTENGSILPVIPAEEGLGFNELDSGLIAYLRDTGMAQQNYTVSPLSYKAALALTALGAEGETQAQILSALGFETVEELTEWYASVLVGVADFEGRNSGFDKADCDYRVVNAIFHNADCDGEFRQTYKELAARTLAAYASSYPSGELTAEINRWVSNQTSGLIPSIVEDVSEAAAVLVNALYLKTKWIEPFADSPLTDFTTVRGETVQKEFITRTEHFGYYEDEGCQIVILPLQGGVNMAVILGDGAGLSAKLNAVQSRKVCVNLPKFEVETSLSNKELVNYLNAAGCGKMFVDSVAEFDPMFTAGIYVDDIVQKAKVKIDENGLEAAAATAVIMAKNTALPNPEKPVNFTADRPFQFVIYRMDVAPELLFWGQIME